MGQVAGYGVVRVALAVLLLVAAVLKAHQLATSPVLGDGFLDSRWVLMAGVEFELFFGLWLLAGLLPRTTWAAAMGCFGLFAGISLYKALGGAASCGCFGRVEVNPWYTFALDLACVLALLRWRPAGVTFVPFGTFLLRSAVVIAAWLAVGAPAAWAMGAYQPSLLGEDGVIVGDGNLVILEPEKWVGKRFPLLDYINIGDTLRQGEWRLLFYHNDCPRCQEAVRVYTTFARSSPARPVLPRVVLVEMPPYGESQGSLVFEESFAVRAKLVDAHKWFLETPIWLEIHDGTLSAVNYGMMSVSTSDAG